MVTDASGVGNHDSSVSGNDSLRNWIG